MNRPSVEIVAGKSQRVQTSVIAGAVAVMFLWAVCFPLINVGLSNSPPMAFAFLRALFAGAALLVIAQWRGRPPITGMSNWIALSVVGFTATSLGFFGMFYGGALVSPGLATVIANVQPLIAAVLAGVILKERLSRPQRWGLVAGFSGIVLIGAPGLFVSNSSTTGVLYIMVGAVGIAISNVILKRLAGHVDSLRAMAWQLIIGSIPLALLALTTEQFSSIKWSLSFVLSLLILSVIGTALAFALWFSLLRRETLSRLNVFTFLTPIFGLVMGAMFFAEKVRGIEVVGIGLSLLGIYWVSRPSTAVVSTPQKPGAWRQDA